MSEDSSDFAPAPRRTPNTGNDQLAKAMNLEPVLRELESELTDNTTIAAKDVKNIKAAVKFWKRESASEHSRYLEKCFNFESVGERKWLKNLLLAESSTESDEEVSEEELKVLLKIHKRRRNNQKKYHTDILNSQYTYYSAGLLSDVDRFPEHQREVLDTYSGVFELDIKKLERDLGLQEGGPTTPQFSPGMRVLQSPLLAGTSGVAGSPGQLISPGLVGANGQQVTTLLPTTSAESIYHFLSPTEANLTLSGATLQSSGHARVPYGQQTPTRPPLHRFHSVPGPSTSGLTADGGTATLLLGGQLHTLTIPPGRSHISPVSSGSQPKAALRSVSDQSFGTQGLNYEMVMSVQSQTPSANIIPVLPSQQAPLPPPSLLESSADSLGGSSTGDLNAGHVTSVRPNITPVSPNPKETVTPQVPQPRKKDTISQGQPSRGHPSAAGGLQSPTKPPVHVCTFPYRRLLDWPDNKHTLYRSICEDEVYKAGNQRYIFQKYRGIVLKELATSCSDQVTERQGLIGSPEHQRRLSKMRRDKAEQSKLRARFMPR